MTETDITLANDAFELLDPFVRAGWTLDCAVFMFDGVGLFFNNGAADGGLCLHLDDDYDAVTNGALRVRIHPERVPFTVGDVSVNRGGIDLTLCIRSQTESKPVVTFNIDRDALNGKELSFNVI